MTTAAATTTNVPVEAKAATPQSPSLECADHRLREDVEGGPLVPGARHHIVQLVVGHAAASTEGGHRHCSPPTHARSCDLILLRNASISDQTDRGASEQDPRGGGGRHHERGRPTRRSRRQPRMRATRPMTPLLAKGQDVRVIDAVGSGGRKHSMRGVQSKRHLSVRVRASKREHGPADCDQGRPIDTCGDHGVCGDLDVRLPLAILASLDLRPRCPCARDVYSVRSCRTCH